MPFLTRLGGACGCASTAPMAHDPSAPGMVHTLVESQSVLPAVASVPAFASDMSRISEESLQTASVAVEGHAAAPRGKTRVGMTSSTTPVLLGGLQLRSKSSERLDVGKSTQPSVPPPVKSRRVSFRRTPSCSSSSAEEEGQCSTYTHDCSDDRSSTTDAKDTTDKSTTSRHRRLKALLHSVVHMTAFKSSRSRRKFIRTPTLEMELAEIEALALPSGDPAIVKHLPSVPDIESLCSALEGEPESGPLANFLKESLGCQDLSMTPWVEDSRIESALSQRSKYKVPLPKGTPDIVKKALGLPSLVPSVTVNCVGLRGDCLILVQRSRSEGVLYSERFRVQHTHLFRAHTSGGVEWKQWTEVVWLKPLPWTHGFLAKIMLQKTLEETKGQSENFAAALLRSAVA
eukprot:CAMPEP_0203941810 /NCGR_PEP_ID=MMETSP0359-20131031/78137_1 /ASSEMBLY_ACC=CAM_ASM_000338 /TAXON_ID=268821 /ORGANISM="Scrippsiella Hangoei, Strain SHTV-5" /LENGTH=401 /DNA_ID=CAMNT_0050872437 /DNA_START=37 /DNA_END=1242 /DNA_ORIENTATION=+